MSEATHKSWIATVRIEDDERYTPGTRTQERGWMSLVRQVRRRFLRWRLEPDELEPGRWWNGSLRSLDQLDNAVRRAKAAGLPVAEERERNWDSLEALELIADSVDRTGRVGDIGLREYGPLLDWLRLLGYERVQPDAGIRSRANRLLTMADGDGVDIAAERLGKPESYDALLCRSLPGDRVPLERRIAQARTLLRPGGIMVLSTEFWDMPDPYAGSESRCSRDHVCCSRRGDALGRAALDVGMVPVAPIYLGEAPDNRHPDLLGVGVSPIKLAFRKRADATERSAS